MTEERKPRAQPSADLQERTLKVTNIHEKVTRELLQELFLQSGPVKNVVHKPDFAFIEFEHPISVAYALALLDGVHLFGQKLELQPKVPTSATQVYLRQLREYEQQYARSPRNWWNRFGNPGEKMPNRLCRAYLPEVPSINEIFTANETAAGSRNDFYQTYTNNPSSYTSDHSPRRRDDFRDQNFQNAQPDRDKDFRGYSGFKRNSRDYHHNESQSYYHQERHQRHNNSNNNNRHNHNRKRHSNMSQDSRHDRGANARFRR